MNVIDLVPCRNLGEEFKLLETVSAKSVVGRLVSQVHFTYLPTYVELTPLSMMECFPHIKAQGVEVNSLPSMIDIYFARTNPTSSYIR